MPEPLPASERPPGGPPRPPAPPTTGEPSRGPDPADPGRPITIRLDDLLLGDLGHPVVDVDLVSAILLRAGQVGQWLRSRGVDLDALDEAFPKSSLDKAPWR